MADVFVSYKRADRDRVAQIVALLQSQGRTVWWDTRLQAGDTWDETIERELGVARCVIVAWSKGSVSSRWVRAEASDALQRNILIPVCIDEVRVPLEFRLVQSLDFSTWIGDPGSPPARELLGAVTKLLGEATEYKLGPTPMALMDVEAAGDYNRAVAVPAGKPVLPRVGSRLPTPRTTIAAFVGAGIVGLLVASIGWYAWSTADRNTTEGASSVPVVRVEAGHSRSLAELLAIAERRVKYGDAIGARDMLFSFAEAFDPNAMAADGIGGEADVAKARALYSKASELGHSRAKARLDALR